MFWDHRNVSVQSAFSSSKSMRYLRFFFCGVSGASFRSRVYGASVPVGVFVVTPVQHSRISSQASCNFLPFWLCSYPTRQSRSDASSICKEMSFKSQIRSLYRFVTPKDATATCFIKEKFVSVYMNFLYNVIRAGMITTKTAFESAFLQTVGRVSKNFCWDFLHSATCACKDATLYSSKISGFSLKNLCFRD